MLLLQIPVPIVKAIFHVIKRARVDAEQLTTTPATFSLAMDIFRRAVYRVDAKSMVKIYIN